MLMNEKLREEREFDCETSIGSHTLATLLAGIAFKRQRGKDFRYRSFFRAFRLSDKNRK